MFQISGCERSGLFQAFSNHILHRLQIKRHHRKDGRIRITFLSRDTMYRKVLNERQLLNALSVEPNYDVQRVRYRLSRLEPVITRSSWIQGFAWLTYNFDHSFYFRNFVLKTIFSSHGKRAKKLFVYGAENDSFQFRRHILLILQKSNYILHRFASIYTNFLRNFQICTRVYHHS